MKVKLTTACLALIAGAGIHQSSAAQSPGANRALAAVEQRQAAMKRIGASMKTLAGFAKGDVTDVAQMRKAAAAMHAGGRQMPKMWPVGTAVGTGKSKAKPEIWAQRGEFNQRIVAFQTAAAAMNRAAATGDKARVAAQLKPLGDSCKACHTPYQLKD
jgi:cytochrome c556